MSTTRTIEDEILATLGEVDALIGGIKAQHEIDQHSFPQPHGSVYGRMDINGRPVLADLVCARAHLLATLANMRGLAR